jgi:hypothetical protein
LSRTFEGQEAIVEVIIEIFAATNGVVIAHGHRQVYAMMPPATAGPANWAWSLTKQGVHHFQTHQTMPPLRGRPQHCN